MFWLGVVVTVFAFLLGWLIFKVGRDVVSIAKDIRRPQEKKAKEGGEPYFVASLVWFLFFITTCFIAGAGVFKMDKVGQFGDVFNVLNALFAGLAFAGIIVTLRLQIEALGLQHKELEATREEMEGSKEALQVTAQISALSSLVQAYGEYASANRKGVQTQCRLLCERLVAVLESANARHTAKHAGRPDVFIYKAQLDRVVEMEVHLSSWQGDLASCLMDFHENFGCRKEYRKLLPDLVAESLDRTAEEAMSYIDAKESRLIFMKQLHFAMRKIAQKEASKTAQAPWKPK